MDRTPSHPRVRPGGHIILDDVNWRTYARFLEMFAERPNVRLAYDRGRLEIMSPLFEHDLGSRCFAYIVLAIAEEFKLPMLPGGTTTLKHKLKRRGIQSDECFWLENSRSMVGKTRLDLTVDPPPDLAIEVEIRRSALNRMSIYAALQVPEVWRLRKGQLSFHLLSDDGKYKEIPASRVFPGISAAPLLAFLQEVQDVGDVPTVLSRFRKWLRNLRKKKAPPHG